MSVLGPYVFTDCSDRNTEASTTVGYEKYQQEAERRESKDMPLFAISSMSF
jgi:hypothetical protein